MTSLLRLISRHILKGTLLAALLVFLSLSGIGQVTTTTTGGGVWGLGGNWDNGVPGINDTAVVNHVMTSAAGIDIRDLRVNAGGSITHTTAGTFRIRGRAVIKGTIVAGRRTRFEGDSLSIRNGGIVETQHRTDPLTGTNITVKNGGTYIFNASNVSVDRWGLFTSALSQDFEANSNFIIQDWDFTKPVFDPTLGLSGSLGNLVLDCNSGGAWIQNTDWSGKIQGDLIIGGPGNPCDMTFANNATNRSMDIGRDLIVENGTVYLNNAGGGDFDLDVGRSFEIRGGLFRGLSTGVVGQLDIACDTFRFLGGDFELHNGGAGVATDTFFFETTGDFIVNVGNGGDRGEMVGNTGTNVPLKVTVGGDFDVSGPIGATFDCQYCGNIGTGDEHYLIGGDMNINGGLVTFNGTNGFGGIHNSFFTIDGDLNITGGETRFADTQGGTNIDVAGETNVSGGTTHLIEDDAATVTLETGDFIQSGGTFFLSNTPGGNSIKDSVIVNGDFRLSAGTFQFDGNAASTVDHVIELRGDTVEFSGTGSMTNVSPGTGARYGEVNYAKAGTTVYLENGNTWTKDQVLETVESGTTLDCSPGGLTYINHSTNIDVFFVDGILEMGTQQVQKAAGGGSTRLRVNNTGRARTQNSLGWADIAAASTIDIAGGADFFLDAFSTIEYNGINSQVLSEYYPFTSQNHHAYGRIEVNNSSAINDTLTLTLSTEVRTELIMTDGIVETSNINMIIMRNGSSSSGGSDTSFVSGPIQKESTNDFLFPTGKDGVYAPLEIVGVIGNILSVFTAEYFAASHPNQTVNPPLNNVSSLEYWDLTNTGTPSTVDLILHWEDSAASVINNAADLSIAHFNGGQWDKQGQTSIVMGSQGEIRVNGVTGFSPFTFGSDDPNLNPLAPSYFWVGDAGNWSDAASHWATSSGGSTFHPSAPSSTDDVVFDANSFSSAGLVVTIDAFADCKNFDLTGSNNPSFSGTNQLNIYGNFTGLATATWPHSGGLSFQNSSNALFDPKGIAFATGVTANGTDTLFLESDLDVNNSIGFSINGPFSALNAAGTNSFDINCTGGMQLNSDFIAGTGKVELDGNSNQIIMGFPAPTFYDFEINNSASGIGGAQSMGGSVKTITNQLLLTQGLVMAMTGNEFRIDVSGSIVGASSSSYIVGACSKVGNGDFTYPVGSESFYAPVTLSNLTGAATTEFQVIYERNPHFDAGNVTGVLNNVSINEFWEVNSVGTASNCDMNLTWADRSDAGIDNSADLVIAHYGAQWASIGQSAINYGVNGDITVNGVSTFSPFTFGSQSAVVNPLTLNDTLKVGDSESYATIQTAYDAIPDPTDQEYWIEIQSDYDDSNEFFPIFFGAKATANYPINVVVASGVTSMEIAGDPGFAGGQIFNFNAASHVTIDGRPGGSGASELLIRNTRITGDAGPVFELHDDADSNVVQYVTIEGEPDGGLSTPLFLFGGDCCGSSGNDSNQVRHCVLSDLTVGGTASMPIEGVGSYGVPGQENDDNIIDSCEIIDVWGGVTNASAAIRIGSDSRGWTIRGNSIYQTSAHPNLNFMSEGILVETGDDHVIEGNYIGGRAKNCGGASYDITSGSKPYSAIRVVTGTGDITIENNTVANISITSANDDPTYSGFNAILNEGDGETQIGSTGNGNLIGNMSSNSITITDNGTFGASSFTAIQNGGTDSSSVIANSIGGITIGGTSSDVDIILVANGATSDFVFSDNTIGGNVANSIVVNSDHPLVGVASFGTDGLICSGNTLQNWDHNGSSWRVQCIANMSDTMYAADNIIRDISSDGDSGFVGIAHYDTFGDAQIRRNEIYDIALTGATDEAGFVGVQGFSDGLIEIDSNSVGGATANNISVAGPAGTIGIQGGGAGDVEITNNTIQQINQTSTAATGWMSGIVGESGTCEISDNTVRSLTSNSTTGGEAIRGIELISDNTGHLIADNTILDLVASTTSGTADANVVGIQMVQESAPGHEGTVERNLIDSLSSGATQGTTIIAGIQWVDGDYDVFNNVVLLDNPGYTNDALLVGIHQVTPTGGNVNNRVHHNTIDLAGSIIAGVNPSYGVVFEDNQGIDFQNNIVKNLRTGGTGTHYVISAVSGGAFTNDYNFYDSPVPLKYEWDATNYNFANWKTQTSGDANATDGVVSLDDVGKAPSSFGGADGGVDLFTGTIVTDDIEGAARDVNPWIGAYESGNVVNNNKYVNDLTFEAGDWTTAGGLNIGGCGGTANPCATVAFAMSQPGVSPGDTIFVDDGLYNQTNVVISQGLVILGIHRDSVTFDDGGGATNVRAFDVQSAGVTLKNFTIENYNSTTNGFPRGGAIRIEQVTGTTSIDSVLFNNNVSNEGGAIGIRQNGGGKNEVVISNSVFTNNQAAVNFGGAVFANQAGGSVVLLVDSSNVFGTASNGNVASDRGGAIYFSGDTLLVRQANIAYNEATNQHGGGIYAEIQNNGAFLIEDCIIDTNEANSGDGGGVWVNASGVSDIDFNATTFSRNQAGFNGGAIYTQEELDITNCLIFENDAATHAAIFTSGPGVSNYTNNTLVDNTSGGNAGVRQTNGTLNLSNNILYANDGDDIDESSGTINVDFCVYQTGSWSGTNTNNFTTDPLFANAVADNYQLGSASSSAYNAGTAGGAPSDDIVGESRPQNGGIDIGAYETNFLPSPDTVVSFVVCNEDSIWVTWDSITSNDLDFYYVYRSTATSWTPALSDTIARVPAGDTSYADVAVATGNTYFYAISSVHNSGSIGVTSQIDTIGLFHPDTSNSITPLTLCVGDTALFLGSPNQSGYALDFDGINDNVQVPSLDINPGNFATMTVSALTYISSGQMGSYGAVITNDNGGFDRGLMHHPSNTYAIFAGRNVNTGIPVMYDQWVHLAAVWSSAEVTLYINGQQVYTEGAETVTVGSTTATIGGGSWDIEGKLDELSVWSKRLTDVEILSLYNNSVTGVEPGLEAYYDFEDGPGSGSLNDLTANAHNGTLASMSPATDWELADPAYTYFWDFGDASNSTLSSAIHDYSAEGTYGATYAVTNTTSGCVLSSVSVDVSVVNPLLVTSSSNDSICGTLRFAIGYANTNPGPDTITFDTTAMGGHTIQPVTGLPAITGDSTVIWGDLSSDGDPDVEINGTLANVGVDGIRIQGSHTVIAGLVINKFTDNGIDISGGDSSHVLASYIGTDFTGMIDSGNSSSGIRISLSAFNRIGDGSVKNRNIVSGNNSVGIELVTGAPDNIIQGNFIGLGVDGVTEIQNNTHGISGSNGATGTIIGNGTLAGRNVISGNAQNGINLEGNNNIIKGNYIGVDSTGLISRPNNHGVRFTNVSNGNVLGDTTSGILPNVIAGNGGNGVFIISGDNNSIDGNYIGVGSDGASPLGNGINGIEIFADQFDTLVGNIIAYNQIGIDVSGGSADDLIFSQNSIYNNLNEGILFVAGAQEDVLVPTISALVIVGSDTIISGTASANAVIQIFCDSTHQGQQFLDTTVADGAGDWSKIINGYGVYDNNGLDSLTVLQDSAGNTSEFSAPFFKNPTCNNVLVVTSSADDSTCGTLRRAIGYANFNPGSDTITFDTTAMGGHTIAVTGTALPAITDDSTVVYGDLSGDGDPDVEIDGAALSGSENGLHINSSKSVIQGLVINGFPGHGVFIEGAANDSNYVLTSFIGLDYAGGTSDANALAGVRITDADRNFIGNGTSAGLNVISGNTQSGVQFVGSDANQVYGNFIGTNTTGTIDRGNGQDGINIDNSDDNMIGNGLTGGGNVISGNSADGIKITNAGATGNMIYGNNIGVDATGNVAMSNSNGIFLTNTSDNIIGDTVSGYGNVISGNSSRGININPSDNNRIIGNVIGLGRDSSSVVPNSSQGILMNGGSNNDTINYNIIAENGAHGIAVFTGSSIDNIFFGNSIYNNSTGILISGSQQFVDPPRISTILVAGGDTTIYGTSAPGALIQLYCDSADQGQVFVDTTMADGSGDWSKVINGMGVFDANGLDSLTALQDSSDNTSEFAAPYFKQVCDTSGATAVWTWEGDESVDWFDCRNWDQGALPGANASVLIPGGTPFDPEIAGGTGYCKDIDINTATGGILNVNTPAGGAIDIGP